MKKLFTLLTMLIVAISTSWADNYTETYTNPTSSNPPARAEGKGAFTVITLGTGDIQWGNSSLNIKTNGGTGSFTVSTLDGSTISEIRFTQASSYPASSITSEDGKVTGPVENVWTYTPNTAKTSASFSMTSASSKKARIAPIAIDITSNYEYLSKNFTISSGVVSCTRSNPSSDLTLASNGSISNNGLSVGNGKTLTITSAGHNIKSIHFTYESHNNVTYSASTGTCGVNSWNADEDTKTVTFTSSGSSVIVGISVELEEISTDPSISAENVDIAATTTGGNIAFTVNNPVEGGTISAEDDAEWLTVGKETTSPISFTATANTGAERSATVTLTYTYDTDKTVTKDVTVTQAAAAIDVVLNGNGGSNGAATITEGGTQLTITTAPAYENHSLLGYLTTATGTKVAEANGTLIASVDGYTDGDGKWIGGEGKTLYAQWLTNSDAAFSNGQYVIGGSALDLSTLFTSSSDGAVTYTVKSAGDTGAAIAIDGTSFTATAPGTATVTATQAATATYAGASLDATITVGKTTGANTIEWELSPIGSNKATLTSTQTSTSLYLKNLTTINHSLVGLASSPSSASNRTAKVNRLAGKDDSKYVYVTFDVEDGYTFVPSKVTIKVANVNNVTTFDAELVGENGESVGETGKTFSSTDGTVETWEITPTVEKSLTGTVTLKIYAYAETDGAFRFGTPIKIAGAVLPEPKEITLSSTDGKTKGFATFCGAQNFTVSGATAYKAAINEDKIVLTTVGNADAVIPAEVGIIIAGEKAATATVTYTTDDATADMLGNSLKGTTARVATSTLKNSATDKVVGFFKTPSAFKSYTGENFPANLAYFLLTAENAVESFDIVFDGETAINSIDANDNANSVAPVKVIKNGKLYIGNYNVAGQQVK